MKTEEERFGSGGKKVSYKIPRIMRKLKLDGATTLSLDNPIFYENVADEVWEKCNTDHVFIAKLLRNGFVTVEQITDMANGIISASTYEEIAIPYGVLPTETMSKILHEVASNRYESY